jgi:dipeptidyl aminopeptidase/acylaminoacyl peptidase
MSPGVNSAARWLGTIVRNLATPVILGVPICMVLVGTFQAATSSLRVILLEPDVQVWVNERTYYASTRQVGPIELEPGTYWVRVKRGSEILFSHRVDLKPGALQEVCALWKPQPASARSASQVPSLGQGKALSQHFSAVTGVGFSGDGRRVLSVGEDRILRIWSLDSGRAEREIEAHLGLIGGLLVLGDGKRVLTLGGDGLFKVWDVATGNEVRSIESALGAKAICATLAPDGRRLAVAGETGVVWILDLESDREGQLHYVRPASVSSVSFASDGRTLLIGLLGSPHSEHGVEMYDVESDKVVGHLRGHEGAVWGLAPMPDGRRLLTAGSDQTMRLWDLASGRELQRFSNRPGAARCLTVTTDGRYALAGTGYHWSTVGGWQPADGYGVQVWDLDEGQLIGRFETDGPVFCLALSADGRRALAGGEDSVVHAWEMPRGIASAVQAARRAPAESSKTQPSA